MTGKRCGREDERETSLGVRNVGHYAVNHIISTGDKRFLRQPNTRIVKHPYAVMFVRGDNIDGVH
jgi:hypothetical protein